MSNQPALAIVSVCIAVISLLVSIAVAWFTHRRGKLCCTRPVFLALKYDHADGVPWPKIFLRALLFSTGKRGLVVESLWLRARDSAGCLEEFSFWGYGDKDLVRGSGLFVPEVGSVTNHHFNPLGRDSTFRFHGGPLHLELVAKVLGCAVPVSLWHGTVDLPTGAFEGEGSYDTAVWLNWSPQRKRYIASIETRAVDLAVAAKGYSGA